MVGHMLLIMDMMIGACCGEALRRYRTGIAIAGS